MIAKQETKQETKQNETSKNEMKRSETWHTAETKRKRQSSINKKKTKKH